MFIAGLLVIITLALLAWRWTDKNADKSAWSALDAHQPPAPGVIDATLVAELPEPAQRFFHFAIRPGTPLHTVATIRMAGDFSLGTRDNPRYMKMQARQVLAAPYGFVWRLQAGTWMRISGSDGATDGFSWSRFWLFGLFPVARAGGNEDHARSAFGRFVAEAVFWTPAALLPSDNVQWDAVDEATARVTVTHGGMAQTVDISVAADGSPGKIVFQRWSDANASKIWQRQPFGGYLSHFEDFGGFRLPTRIEAGNFFETADYFPFFRVDVSSIEFPPAPGAKPG
jgi:hypothetical protein